MKKIIFTVALCCAVCLSFGQKKTVGAAKSEIKGTNPNIAEARSLIKQALENPETKDQAETWYVAGQIEDKQFDIEHTKEMLGQKPNEAVMYEALGNVLPYFEKAAELDQLPDEKGKVKPKFLKDIKSRIKVNRPSYANAGIYYFNTEKNYKKAYENLKLYGDILDMKIFEGEKWENLPPDTSETQLRYYAALAAANIPDPKASAEIMEGLKDKPLMESIEHELYVNLSREYLAMKDTVNYYKTIEEGYNKYPTDGDFLRGMINKAILDSDLPGAVGYLDKAIEAEPDNAQFYDLRAQVYEIRYNTLDDKNAPEADQYVKNAISDFEKAIEKDKTGEASYLSNLGRVFFNLAVENRAKSDDTKDKAQSEEYMKISVDYFQKALPLFEKAYELDSDDLKTIYALSKIYYELKKGDKYEQFEKLYISKSGGSQD
jgi:tetratricopeptide (TPR) repeat protein